MGLIWIGIGFGLIMGTGLYFLLIRPALKERAEAEAAAESAAKEQQDQ